MLMKLSFRNVKRQFDEYTLFFVTLTSTVASMYAFNALIFSDTVKALPEMELLPYLIIAAVDYSYHGVDDQLYGKLYTQKA